MILGVVSDTHVPDRVAGLHQDLLFQLRQAGVQQILHCGDICSPQVLKCLAEVAPVSAVRGNRDWLFAGKLPWRRDLDINGVSFAVMHGMGSWRKYLEYKLRFGGSGYSLEYYLPLVRAAAPHADVIVFGHTHFPEIVRQDGQLIINPGSASLGRRRGWKPTFGLLAVSADGQVDAMIREVG